MMQIIDESIINCSKMQNLILFSFLQKILLLISDNIIKFL